MNTAGGVFGQYNLCNRYNGYTDFQNFVQNQASFPFYNHHQPHDSINNHGQFTPAFSEFQGHHHHHATSHPTTGLQFIADVTENDYCHWNNGAIVQQPYYNHANYAAMVPNPSTMGPHPSPPIVYDQAVQTTDYVFPQESSAKHMNGFHQITTNTNHGNLQHTFDSRPTWLKRRDSCVFCRVYDGKEPNEIMFRDDNFVAFADHRPVAANHLLVVTKMHVPNIMKLTPQQRPIVEDMVKIGKQLLFGRGANVEDSRMGFHKPPRNSVPHLHLHVISPASTLSFGEKKRFGLDTWFFTPADELISELMAQA